MPEINTKFLCEVHVELEIPIPVGAGPRGDRKIFYVKRGTFEGPEFKGRLLPGGGDWFLQRNDGIGELDVRGIMETEDGDLIYISYRGYLQIPAEVSKSMNEGKSIAPSEYYFRTVPFFETSSEKLSWLNHTLAVGIGRLTSTGVSYKIYSIL